MATYTIGISGGSGSPYALRLLAINVYILARIDDIDPARIMWVPKRNPAQGLRIQSVSLEPEGGV